MSFLTDFNGVHPLDFVAFFNRMKSYPSKELPSGK